LAGTNSLEIEIHRLFQEGTSVEYVCRELVSKYEKSEVLSPSEIEGLSHFLITCGRLDLLRNLYIKTVSRSKTNVFPVGYFIEAIEKQNKEISNEVIDICNALIEKQPYNSTALKSSTIKTISWQALKESQDIQKNFTSARLLQKTKLIEQLNNYRVSQLQEQESAVLQKLLKLFPQDLEISLLKQAHLEKKADEILAKIISNKNLTKAKSSLDRNEISTDFISETKKQILQIASDIKVSAPDQLYNLAVLAFQAELFDVCLKILDLAPETEARNWLLAEALLEERRFLDLLKVIANIEQSDNLTSDGTFGATYLKALAYHGLGQKEKAINLLESILQITPVYRSAEALLQEWKQDWKSPL